MTETLPFAEHVVKPLRCNLQNGLADNTGMEFHERLKHARKRKYKTATLAALALGIPHKTLAHHEAGTRGVKRDEVARYARAYGVELPWLAHEQGPEVRGQGGGLLSAEERLVLDAYRLLPEEEAAAHRNLLLARTGLGAPAEPEPAEPAQKRGVR